jgi:hypothetical protein
MAKSIDGMSRIQAAGLCRKSGWRARRGAKRGNRKGTQNDTDGGWHLVAGGGEDWQHWSICTRNTSSTWTRTEAFQLQWRTTVYSVSSYLAKPVYYEWMDEEGVSLTASTGEVCWTRGARDYSNDYDQGEVHCHQYLGAIAKSPCNAEPHVSMSTRQHELRCPPRDLRRGQCWGTISLSTRN